MARHPFRLVDVFTDRPLAGNQLAVFTRGEDLDESLLQPVAREMNLSETVFLFPPRAGGTARIRLFSTVTELPFGGHPVLGTAALLGLDLAAGGGGQRVLVRLETGRGTIPVEVEVRPGDPGDHGAAGAAPAGAVSGWMEQPRPSVRPWYGDQEALLAALGLAGSELPVEVYDNGVPHLFVVASSPAAVLAITLDAAALRRICPGPMINCVAGADGRYVARMFSPFDYVPEDPACGSAAGPLAIHLVRYGLETSGTEIVISQGERVGRPSTLLAAATVRDGVVDRVRVGGSCRPVGDGALFL